MYVGAGATKSWPSSCSLETQDHRCRICICPVHGADPSTVTVKPPSGSGCNNRGHEACAEYNDAHCATQQRMSCSAGFAYFTGHPGVCEDRADIEGTLRAQKPSGPAAVPPAAPALLRIPNSLLSLSVRWRLGRCCVRVDRDGAPLRLYVVSAVDHQGVAVPLRDTRLRAWAVDPCRPFHREVHTSECCMKAGPKRPVDDSPLPFSSAALPSQQFAQLCGVKGPDPCISVRDSRTSRSPRSSGHRTPSPAADAAMMERAPP
jgi:hypothetical protein